jgi:hypothetical protein
MEFFVRRGEEPVTNDLWIKAEGETDPGEGKWGVGVVTENPVPSRDAESVSGGESKIEDCTLENGEKKAA